MAVKKTETVLRNEIDSLFADNLNGDITASDIRTFLNTLLDNLVLEKATLQTTVAQPAQTIGTTYVKLDGFTVGDQTRTAVTASAVNDSFTVAADGFYRLTGRIVIEFASNRVIVAAGGINAIPTPFELPSQGSGTGSPTVYTFPGNSILLSAGDVIDVRLKADASTSIVMTNAFLQLEYLPLGEI
jgi:hypothetical protein